MLSQVLALKKETWQNPHRFPVWAVVCLRVLVVIEKVLSVQRWKGTQTSAVEKQPDRTQNNQRNWLFHSWRAFLTPVITWSIMASTNWYPQPLIIYFLPRVPGPASLYTNYIFHILMPTINQENVTPVTWNSILNSIRYVWGLWERRPKSYQRSEGMQESL